MSRLGTGVDELVSGLAEGGDEAGRKTARAAAVNVKWENAVRAVYKDKADFVLGHVNAVYIMAGDAQVKGAREDGSPRSGKGTQLVVYADDSLVRSDLDARQEFLKLKLNEQGERVEAFRIVASRFDMKARHPFQKREPEGEGSTDEEAWWADREPVSQEGLSQLDDKADRIEDPAVKAALKKAMNSNLAC